MLACKHRVLDTFAAMVFRVAAEVANVGDAHRAHRAR
jgi:hypothetical protein